MKKEWLDYCTQKVLTDILTSNGMLSRLDPPLESYLNLPEAMQVRNNLEKFLSINPQFLVDIDDFLEDIADGDVDENEEMYGELVWYAELNESLNEFFNVEVQIKFYSKAEEV